MHVRLPYRRTALITLAAVLAVFCSLTATAQKETWNWYFGQNAGLSFRTGFAVPLADGALVTDEGCATQSDPITGDLLFYTNGQTVWNRNHEVMRDGTGLSGDPSTSQTLIVPMPGNPFAYYIFNSAPVTSNTTDGRCFCLTYSIVDLRQANGLGAVTVKNTQLLDDITEHLSAAQNCRGDGYWVVARRRSSRHFVAFSVDAVRVNPTFVQSDGSNPQLVIRDAGQMHISPDGRRLVITATTGNSQLYTFDPATGIVSNGASLFPEGEVSAHYGAAFTHDSRYVYIAATTLSGAQFYRFRADLPSPSATAASIEWVHETAIRERWVPMQLGPDRRIYIGNPNEGTLTVIERPWRVDVDSILLVPNAIDLSEGRIRNGLPNMIGTSLFPDALSGVGCQAPLASFSIADVCEGACVTPVENSTGAIDKFEWTFQGGTPSSSVARFVGQVCYAKAGSYTLKLVASNAYGSDTTERTITVFPKPNVIADSVVDICQGASVTLRAAGAHRYAWTPALGISGANTASPTVSPRFTTRYTVIGTTDNGCADTSTVLVRVVEMKAGPDVSVCRGGRVRLTASGGTRYAWQPANLLDDPTSPMPWATLSESTTFTVLIERDSCVFFDSLEAVVTHSTQLRTSPDTTICRGHGAQLRAISPGADSVLWSPSDGLDAPRSFLTIARPTSTTTYAVRVWVGSCTAVDSVTITVVDGATVAVQPVSAICKGDTTSLSARTTNARSVAWLPADNISDPTSASPQVWPTETTTYVCTATSDNGCTAVDSVTVVVGLSVDADAGPNRWICPGQVTQLLGSTTGSSLRWFPEAGLSDPGSLSPLASPTSTTTYYLRASLGRCQAVDSVTVTVSTLQEMRVTPDTTLCLGTSMRLHVDGTAERYEWSPPQGLSDPTSASPLASPTETTTYTVRAFDAGGCEVEARLTITVVSNPPITLRIGSVQSPAGTNNVPVPVFIDVDPSMLPLRISLLQFRLGSDVSIFLPSSADIGLIVPAVCGGIRCTYLRLEDITLLAPSQRVTTVRGTALLGSGINTAITVDDVTWQGGVRCPQTQAISGSVTVTGCNLNNRVYKMFQEATLSVQVLESVGVVRMLVGGTAPGDHTLRMVALDGTTVWQTGVQRSLNSSEPTAVDVALPWLGSGLYYAQLIDPFGTVTTIGVSVVR